MYIYILGFMYIYILCFMYIYIYYVLCVYIYIMFYVYIYILCYIYIYIMLHIYIYILCYIHIYIYNMLCIYIYIVILNISFQSYLLLDSPVNVPLHEGDRAIAWSAHRLFDDQWPGYGVAWGLQEGLTGYHACTFPWSKSQ